MNDKQLCELISEELSLNLVQVVNTIELLDEGNTVPFITRYRKEKTGSLDENQIREIDERIKYLRTLEERKKTILKSIQEQGKLTDELRKKIVATIKMQELEDLYLPYRPKKRTRATVAREKGLEPLAQLILKQEKHDDDRLKIASDFIDSEKEVEDAEAALAGARDIIAEIFSENADIRKQIRQYTVEKAFLSSKAKKEGSDRVYETYFDYSEPVKKIKPHRMLAINRGEKEGALKVNIDVNVDEVNHLMKDQIIKNINATFIEDINLAITDSYQRLIAPAIHREIRSSVTVEADSHAISVFALNLKNLLMQPPLLARQILGIDPGFRTGCKVAVIDETGKYLEGTTIYPHAPQKEYFEAKTAIRQLVDKYHIEIIAIGNGTASRETELMVAELIKEVKSEREVVYHIVNEAGASVYSASKVAQDEFPDLDASMRGNISIARRLQDPLAELVKIDPKSIGVGLYQHDVNQKSLAEALHNVVESCVNAVGVDLNTASASLLKYISGINDRSAKNIIKYREKAGRFKNRNQLFDVDGIGENAFQQCAGFLRIRDGENSLDATSIHPESYNATNKLLNRFKITDIHQGGGQLKQMIKDEKIELRNLADEIDCGLPTLKDILNDIEKPGRDPRESDSGPVFRSDVLKMEDLKPGMQLKGTVRNVVDFGLFVDIGVKQDGLVHISEMADKYVKSPHEIAGVGDTVDIKVLSVDLERGRIALSMKKK
jgi:protein Tex